MAEDSLTLQMLFHASAKVLNALFEETRVLTHRGMKGERREVIFRNFLRRWLPTQFAVGHGLVVSADGSVSNELDCIVYDPTVAPALYCFDPRVSEEYRVFAIETVVALFAVKSVLDSKDTLREACENLDSAASLKPSPTPYHVVVPGFHVAHGDRGSFDRPYSAVVAYGSKMDDETIKEWLNEELQAGSALPDAVWVPGNTLIVRFDPGRKPSYRGLLVFPERGQCFAAIVGNKEDYGLTLYFILFDFLTKGEPKAPNIAAYLANLPSFEIVV